MPLSMTFTEHTEILPCVAPVAEGPTPGEAPWSLDDTTCRTPTTGLVVVDADSFYPDDPRRGQTVFTLCPVHCNREVVEAIVGTDQLP